MHQINNRGQITAFDLIVSIIVFSIIMSTIFSSYTFTVHHIDQELQTERLESKASALFDSLVLRPGNPSNWELRDLNRTKMLGLAVEPFVLDYGKVQEFNSMDYNTLKTLLRLNGMEYYLAVKRDKVILLEKGAEIYAEFSVGVERTVQYDGNYAHLQIWLYQ